MPGRRAIAIGLALWGLAWVTDRASVPEPGEPLVLRWFRALAEHPVRGPLGLVLLTLAARPNRPSHGQEGRSEAPPPGRGGTVEAAPSGPRRP